MTRAVAGPDLTHGISHGDIAQLDEAARRAPQRIGAALNERQPAGQPDAMSDTAHGVSERGDSPVGGHPHRHGKPSSWVLISVIVAAFIAGGVALIVQYWWLFWVSAGVVLLSIPAGRVIRIMDDTVIMEGLPDGQPVAADRGLAADPGVRPEPPERGPGDT